MYLGYLFFISSLLLVDVKCDCDHVKCDCDHYIDCFTKFLREFFLDNNKDDTEHNKMNVTTKHFELNDEDDLDQVLHGLIKALSVAVEDSVKVEKENKKTKIYVTAFRIGNASENVGTSTTVSDVIESTTETIEFSDILARDDSETTANNLNVIPLKNNKANEIGTKDILNRFLDDLNDNDDDDDDNGTDYLGIDYIDLYKDTTNEYVEYVTREPTTNPTVFDFEAEIVTHNENDIDNAIDQSLNDLNNLIQDSMNHTVESCNGGKMVLSGAIFPWIATIFVKNTSKGDQFDYVCDGALVSSNAVLTAARCTHNGSHFVSADNIIVILGKTSLQVSRGNENILRVKEVKRHENFTMTNGITENDLAVLNLEYSVALNNAINTVCLNKDEESADNDEQNKEAVTTAWSPSGDLTLIYFDKEKSKACRSDNKVENTFCATYGNDVALCPSYGGLYVSKSSNGGVYLQGLRTGNPLDRGICYKKDVMYTSLKNYIEWIDANVKAVKN